MAPAVMRTDTGVVTGDHHQGVVLAVVGASGGAEEAVHQVVQPIQHQVQADEFGKTQLLASLLLCQVVNIQADLVEVGSGFRDGGDGHDPNADHNGERKGIREIREGEFRSCEERVVPRELKSTKPNHDREQITGDRAQQDREHTNETLPLQINGKEDRHHQGEEGDTQPCQGVAVAWVARSKVPKNMPRAAELRPIPMTIATDPVMMGGRILSTPAFPPVRRMIRPTRILITPVAMKPVWTTEMVSGEAVWPNAKPGSS